MEKDEVARDTIAAIATPIGRGGIGVVRLSGPKVREIAQALTGRLLKARNASLCLIRDARGERIDEGIVLYFPAPHSYTGEAVLELHGHRGAAGGEARAPRPPFPRARAPPARAVHPPASL